MPPRSTCHHPEPSHGNDTMLPPIWSITMIPSLPMLCKRVEWEWGAQKYIENMNVDCKIHKLQ